MVDHYLNRMMDDLLDPPPSPNLSVSGSGISECLTLFERLDSSPATSSVPTRPGTPVTNPAKHASVSYSMEDLQFVLPMFSLAGGEVRGLSTLIILRELMRTAFDLGRSYEGNTPASFLRKELGGESKTLKPKQLDMNSQFFDLLDRTRNGGLISLSLDHLNVSVADLIRGFETGKNDVFRQSKGHNKSRCNRHTWTFPKRHRTTKQVRIEFSRTSPEKTAISPRYSSQKCKECVREIVCDNAHSALNEMCKSRGNEEIRTTDQATSSAPQHCSSNLQFKLDRLGDGSGQKTTTIPCLDSLSASKLLFHEKNIGCDQIHFGSPEMMVAEPRVNLNCPVNQSHVHSAILQSSGLSPDALEASRIISGRASKAIDHEESPKHVPTESRYNFPFASQSQPPVNHTKSIFPIPSFSQIAKTTVGVNTNMFAPKITTNNSATISGLVKLMNVRALLGDESQTDSQEAVRLMVMNGRQKVTDWLALDPS